MLRALGKCRADSNSGSVTNNLYNIIKQKRAPVVGGGGLQRHSTRMTWKMNKKKGKNSKKKISAQGSVQPGLGSSHVNQFGAAKFQSIFSSSLFVVIAFIIKKKRIRVSFVDGPLRYPLPRIFPVCKRSLNLIK